MNRESTLTNALLAAASTERGLRAIEHDGQTSLLPYRLLLTQALVGAGALSAAGLERTVVESADSVNDAQAALAD